MDARRVPRLMRATSNGQPFSPLQFAPVPACSSSLSEREARAAGGDAMAGNGKTEEEPAPPEKPPHYLGHRQRLRERFRLSIETLPDYELLELVLCQAVPQRDM